MCVHEPPTHDLHSIPARARSLCTLSVTYVGQGPCGVAAASVSRPVAAGPAASHCPSLVASAAHEAQMSCTVSEVRQTCLPIVRDACLVHFVDASEKIDASKLPTPLAEALWHHEKGDEPAHAEWLGCARTGPRARRDASVAMKTNATRRHHAASRVQPAGPILCQLGQSALICASCELGDECSPQRLGIRSPQRHYGTRRKAVRAVMRSAVPPHVQHRSTFVPGRQSFSSLPTILTVPPPVG